MILAAEPRMPELDTARYLRQSRINRLRRRLRDLRMEAVRLYEPLPAAERFFASAKPIRIVDGSNQSGKTLACLIELLYAISGLDPYGKYPKKGGRAVVVGYKDTHLSDPIWRKLSREGEFKLIPDEHTGQWRAVRPDPANPLVLDPYDQAYSEKWRDAPPLLPPRLIKGRVAFRNKAEEIPAVLHTTTGWRVDFMSSFSSPPQGRQLNLAYFDEELYKSHIWLNEIAPRMCREEGRIIWGATPETGGIALWKQRQKALAGDPYVDRTTLLIRDNPFISEEAKRIFYEALTDEQVRAVKYHGEYALIGRQVYSTYDPMGIHGCEPFEIPHDWARYGIVDPGTRALSCLFVAVDPEEAHLWVYDGFVMEKAERNRWAHEVRRRSLGRPMQAWIMDQQAGRQHAFGDALNVAQQYWEALVDAGVKPWESSNDPDMGGFYPGTNDVRAREEALRSALLLRGPGPHVGTAGLQVFRGQVPDLDGQIGMAATKEGTLDKREKLQDEGLLECLEYVAAFRPRYHPPPKPRPTRIVDEAAQNLRRQNARRDARRRGRAGGLNFGPSISIG